MKFSITEKSKSEFEFYLNTQMDSIGHIVGKKITGDPDGYTALECWWANDTHGIYLPCSEPELLEKAHRGKKSVNLQVKMWAEDVADGMLLGRDELQSYTNSWPDWVFRAVIHQASKISLSKIGFVPTFIKGKNQHGTN